jgi:hypothetical protein
MVRRREAPSLADGTRDVGFAAALFGLFLMEQGYRRDEGLVVLDIGWNVGL